MLLVFAGRRNEHLCDGKNVVIMKSWWNLQFLHITEIDVKQMAAMSSTGVTFYVNKKLIKYDEGNNETAMMHSKPLPPATITTAAVI